jgi:hypothetical protein
MLANARGSARALLAGCEAQGQRHCCANAAAVLCYSAHAQAADGTARLAAAETLGSGPATPMSG